MTLPFVLTITGPSCAGKNYFADYLTTEHQDRFELVKSHSTRPPRTDMDDEYHFVSPEQFKGLIEAGEFAEYVDYGNCYYGTSRSAVEQIINNGKIPIIICEPVGADNITACGAVNGLWKTAKLFLSDSSKILVKRWLERMKRDPMPVLDYYSLRMWKTLFEEIYWEEATVYNIKIPSASLFTSEEIFKKLSLYIANPSCDQVMQISTPQS